MPAVPVINRRVVLAEDAFVEIVVWRLDRPLQPSSHRFKYSLAYVVDRVCVLRYDNERGKGDHRHVGENESAYAFRSPEQLLADFAADVRRWNDEHGRA